MKKIILILIFLLNCLFAIDLTVQISNIKNDNGKLTMGLFDTQDSFKKATKPYKGVKVDISNKTAKYIFKDLPNKTYALSVYHDENDNNKLDKNWFGVPKESYGWSNNPKPSMRSATFDEGKFEFKNNLTIDIKLLD
jgi:uncharacterized protein (DUF2141 family)